MIRYKQSVDALILVRLRDSTGAAVTGVAFGSVVATIVKSDGTTATVSPSNPHWTELTTGAWSGLGVYELTVTSGNLNLVGVLGLAVTGSTGSFTSYYEVIANLESDIYTRLGTPAGADVSTDIASIKSDTTFVPGYVLNTLADVKAAFPVGIEFKQGVNARFPVRLINQTNGNPQSGIDAAITPVTCTLYKGDGTSVDITPADSAHFVELTVGSYSGQGWYDLIVSSAVLNVPGVTRWAAKTGTSALFEATVKLVANEEVDTFARLGVPVGASTSADIAAVQTKLGAPAGASVSADVAGVKSDTTALISSMVKALGMLHENSVLDMTAYDAFNNMTAGRLRLYDTKANALAAGLTGLLHTYTIAATYAGANMLTYTVVLES